MFAFIEVNLKLQIGNFKSTRSALFAGTNLTQIGEGIDAGSVAVIPVELDRVMTDLRSSRNLDGTFSEHWERIRLGLYFWRLIPAGGAGAILAEVGVRIGGLMTVVPGDGDSAGGGELYRGRDKIHRDNHCSIETVGGGVWLAMLIWAATALAISRKALA